MPDNVILEPEVIAASLKEMGCPFSADDNRSVDWLAGYQAGYTKAADDAIARMDSLLNG